MIASPFFTVSWIGEVFGETLSSSSPRRSCLALEVKVALRIMHVPPILSIVLMSLRMRTLVYASYE